MFNHKLSSFGLFWQVLWDVTGVFLCVVVNRSSGFKSRIWETVAPAFSRKGRQVKAISQELQLQMSHTLGNSSFYAQLQHQPLAKPNPWIAAPQAAEQSKI